jgi:ribosomal protein L13
MAKPAEALPERKWWVVDATNQPLGRLASRIATVRAGSTSRSTRRTSIPGTS